MVRTKVEFVTEELLPGAKLSRRSIRAIEESRYGTESMRGVLDYLVSKRVGTPRIITNAHLLARNPKSLERNYEGNRPILAHYYNKNSTDPKVKGDLDKSITSAGIFLVTYPTLFGVTPTTTETNMTLRQRLDCLPQDYQLYSRRTK